MKITYENEDRPLMKNCFIEEDNFGVYGWYGLTCFEVAIHGEPEDIILHFDKDEFEQFYNLISEMKKEIDTQFS